MLRANAANCLTTLLSVMFAVNCEELHGFCVIFHTRRLKTKNVKRNSELREWRFGYTRVDIRVQKNSATEMSITAKVAQPQACCFQLFTEAPSTSGRAARRKIRKIKTGATIPVRTWL